MCSSACSQVEDNADVEVIKKRYRKLALQLHPDKNKHPKAELAFKLVLEAYSYLTDSVKRRAFNLERSKNFCIKCNRIPYTLSISLSKSHAPKVVGESNTANRSKWIRDRVKEMKQRFNEEIKVMETCLKANSASGKEAPIFKPSDSCHFHGSARSATPKESPVFDPSNYLFKGYPHIRTRIYRKPDNFWDTLNNYGGQGTVAGRSCHDFPVFEKRSERGILKESAACVYY
ncbi:dnaJ subfamily member [Salix suchowensis]|nr:dnaJ subfamily member [Salix suchowensis]